MKTPNDDRTFLPPAGIPTGTLDCGRLVHAEQIRLLYQQSPGLFLGAGGGALILGSVLWDSIPRSTLILWLVSVSAVHAIIATLWFLHRRAATSPGSGVRWDRLYTVVMGLGGCSWGAAGYFLFVPGALAHQLFLALLLFAAAASGLASTVMYLPAFYACFVPMLLPLIARTASQGDPLHSALALVAVVYAMVLALFARNIHRTIAESLRLRFANMDLVRELTAKKEEAEQASAAKSRFLASASHDLRQPLHTVGLFVDVLDQRVRDSEGRIIINNIRSSLNSLEDLFRALLDISKLDAGVFLPRIQDFPINLLLDRLRTDYAPLAEEKGLALRVVPSGLMVRSDPLLLDRLLRNLISNAVNYTCRGGIVIGCRRRAARARIQVWDSGIGIPDDKQSEIFQEFYQIDNPERDRDKGLGLGLAIVDRIARLLGHRLELRSRPESGSVFSVEIPAVDSGSPRDEQDAVPKPESGGVDLAGCFMVVVEDDRAVLEATRKLLEEWGCRVLAAVSADEALQQLARDAARPDLIVADYRLPEGNTGVQVIRRLRAELKADIPGILVTGDTASSSLRDIQISGYPLLHKPVRPAKLRALLSYALRERCEPWRARNAEASSTK